MSEELNMIDNDNNKRKLIELNNDDTSNIKNNDDVTNTVIKADENVNMEKTLTSKDNDKNDKIDQPIEQPEQKPIIKKIKLDENDQDKVEESKEKVTNIKDDIEKKQEEQNEEKKQQKQDEDIKDEDIMQQVQNKAKAYLDLIQNTLKENEKHKYNEFLQYMKSYILNEITAAQAVSNISTLFINYTTLLDGLKSFLPINKESSDMEPQQVITTSLSDTNPLITTTTKKTNNKNNKNSKVIDNDEELKLKKEKDIVLNVLKYLLCILYKELKINFKIIKIFINNF